MSASGGVFDIAGVPYWTIFGAAFCIVFGRTQIIYWIGRGLADGTLRTRWSRLLDGERAQRAIRAIHRWGPIAVTLSFFTVGVQTVVNITAGYTRMRWTRYSLALVFGSLIWATIWTTIGAVAFNAAVALAVRGPWGWAALAGLGATVACVHGWRRRRRPAPGLIVPNVIPEPSTPQPRT